MVTCSLSYLNVVFLPLNIINAVAPDLTQFGERVVSKQILDWVTDAERNVPYLKGGGRDAFGKRTSELIVSEGWRKLQEYGINQGQAYLWRYKSFEADISSR